MNQSNNKSNKNSIKKRSNSAEQLVNKTANH